MRELFARASAAVDGHRRSRQHFAVRRARRPLAKHSFSSDFYRRRLFHRCACHLSATIGHSASAVTTRRARRRSCAPKKGDWPPDDGAEVASRRRPTHAYAPICRDIHAAFPRHGMLPPVGRQRAYTFHHFASHDIRVLASISASIFSRHASPHLHQEPCRRRRRQASRCRYGLPVAAAIHT